MKPKYSRFFSQSNSPSIANLRIVVTTLAVSVIHLAGSAHAADGTWTGGAAAVWDTSATNWSGVAGTPWDITNGATNRAVFATAAATPAVSSTVYSNGLSITDTVTIAGGTALNLAGTTPTIDASADATISTVVSGTAGLAKTGAGTLTLPSANTYTGVTSITGGVISTGLLAAGGANSGIGAAAASAANLVINGGTLKYTGGALTWSRGFTIGTAGAGFDLSSATGQLWISGSTIAFTGSGPRSLTVTTGTSGGRISSNLVNGTGGATSLVKNGSGTLLLSATGNTYTGQLQILQGTVQFGNAGAGGESTGVGHSVAITSGAILQFRHGNADVVTFNAPISGAGKVNFNFNNNGGSGSASLTLGGINSFSGGLSISPSASGTVTTLYVLPLKAGSTTALGSGTVSIGQYGRLDLNGFSNVTGLLTSTNPAASVTNNGASDVTLTLDGTTTQTFGGVIADGTSKVSIAKAGIGTQTLSGALNTYTGSTSVQAGTLSISNDDQLSDTGAVNLTTGAILNLNHAVAGTDDVGALSVDGVFLASGVYGALLSGAANETALITGTGLLNNLNANEALPHYWDTTGTSWSAAASWTYDAANPASNPPAGPAATSVPIFGANGVTDDTVELGGNQTAAGLSFISPAVFTLTGGGVSTDLSLGSSGISLDADAGAVVIGSAAANQDVVVVLTANQSWTNANAAADVSTVNALNAGTNTLTLAGAGTFTLGGAVTGTGTLTIAGAGASAFGSSVNDFASIAVTGAGAATFSGAITGATSISKRGGGGLDLAGANTYSGGITLDQGTLTVSGNSSAATGSILLRGAGSSGTTFGSAATTATFGPGSVTAVAGGNSIQLGATSFTGNQFQILNANGTMANSGTLTVARAGTVNVGGAWTQNGDATVYTLGGFTATLRVNFGGSFTYASGSDFSLRSSVSAGTGTNLRIDGGTFTTGTRIHNPEATAPAGTASVITLENGGTFRLSAGIADLFTTAGGSRSFVFGTGGGVVDTNGSSTTLNVPVSGTGGITKTGGGTLTLAELNTYGGNTTVSGGILALAQVNASNETSTIAIASGAKIDIAFSGNDTVQALVLNNVNVPAGSYNASHPTYGSFFNATGSGSIVVVPAAAGYASWIDDFGLALADQDPSDDPDNDDMDNLLEFVLNGNPSLSDSSILPDLAVTATHFEFTYQRRDDSVAPETTQTFQWGTTLATWPGSAVVTAGGGSFPPATVTVTPGTPSDAVTDTVKVSIPKSEAGGSGKLFGRLQVVKP